MRALSSLLFLALAIAGGQPALAADGNGAAAVYGVGGLSCKVLASASGNLGQQNTLTQVMQWFGGYLTALNTVTNDTFDLNPILSSSELQGILEKTCLQNPNITVQQAAQNTIQALAVARTKKASPAVEFKNDYGSFLLRQETIVTMQQALYKIGLYQGYANGAVTPALMEAIKAFQSKNNLHRTGLPDAETVTKLIIAPPTKDGKSAG